MKTCPKCNASNADNTKYCTHCGSVLPAAPAGYADDGYAEENTTIMGGANHAAPGGMNNPASYGAQGGYAGQNSYNQAGYGAAQNGYAPQSGYSQPNGSYGAPGYQNGGYGNAPYNQQAGYGGYNNGGSNYQPPKNSRKKKGGKGKKIAIWIIVILVLLAAAGGAYYWFFMREDSSDTDSSSANGSAISVEIDSSAQSSTLTDSNERPPLILEEPPKVDAQTSQNSTAQKPQVDNIVQPDIEKPQAQPEVQKTKYRTNFVMKVRSQPSLSGKQVDRLTEGTTVEVTEFSTADDGGYWGKIGADRWVCIKDKQMTYLSPVE